MKNVKSYPALLLVFTSLVFLYLASSIVASPEQLLRPLLVLWLILLGLAFIISRLIGDKNWASILMMVIVLGFFSNDVFAFSYSIALLSTVLLLWIIFGLLKRKFLPDHFFFIANLMSVLALALCGVALYARFKLVPASYYTTLVDVLKSKNYVELSSSEATKPDIYYIVLDGYGRTDMLKQLYGFDNSKFAENLKQRGFIVPGHSHSNYPRTVLSVTSTLNMDYVQSLTPDLQVSTFWWLLAPWLDHNRVRTSLERDGYISVAISTDWSITDNPTTDIYFKSHPIILSDFDRYFLGATPMKMFVPVFQGFSSVPSYTAHRKSQLNNFTALDASIDIAGPKFVFSHIILPHPPFVFARNGAPITPEYSFSLNDANDYEGTELEYRNLYIGQMQFLNERLEVLIDSILQNSSRPVIIILQADHGPGMLTDFASASRTCLMERFSNFSAYYLPQAEPNSIPDDITPVNLFRIIFNQYFGTNLPLLENASYYSANDIYNFENVTKMLDEQENCSLK